MYNEILLLIKTCVDFWKGFFASENKSEYLKKGDSIGYILMLVLTVLLIIAVVYLIIKLFSGTPEIQQVNPSTQFPIVTEKTQTIPIDGKNVVCNVKVEVYVPKN